MDLENSLNSEILNLKSSLIRIVLAKSKEIPDSINLTIGEPDIQTPKIISKLSAQYLTSHQMTYAPLGGYPELRDEIANFYNRKYQGKYSRENVLVNVGSTEALSTVMRTIFNPGDEAIIVTPAYPLYEALCTLLKVNPVYIDSSVTEYRVTPESIRKNITEKTKAIILNYPSNPCGTMLKERDLMEIVDIIKEKNIFLISDEIYSELAFKGEEYVSPAKFHFAYENIILINGFSKSHSMTGWRIGYTIAHKKLIDHLIKVSQYTVTTPSTLSEYAALIALKENFSFEESNSIYRERSDYFSSLLTNLGFKVINPQGTFYILADYSNLSSLNSVDFALKILVETGVALVPGDAFMAPNCIRVACTQNLDVLQEAGKRLKKYFK